MSPLSSLLGGGGFNGFVPIGPSYATGTATATIVSAGANTDGVNISCASLYSEGYSKFGKLQIDGDTVLCSGSNYVGTSAGSTSAAITGLFVPAGQSISFLAADAKTTYHVNYEVL